MAPGAPAAASAPSASSSAPAPVGNVEVQKDTSSRTWYVGHVVDVVSDTKLLVGFEGDVWPREEFPVARVRKPPKPTDDQLEAFNPKVGEEVELHVAATEHAPASWSLGVVRNIKHDFYFVARQRDGKALASATANEDILEKGMLRAPGLTEDLNFATISQSTFKLPPTLHGWSTTPDAAGCFSHIEGQAGLLHLGLAKAKGSLRLLGDKKALRTASMLLEVHVKHQTQIQNFQDVREKRLKALEQKRNRIEGAGYKHSCEIRVEPGFIPKIIGKNGDAIKSVEERFQVAVRILDAHNDENGEQVVPVRIFGNDPDNVERARAEVEYIEEAIQIESPEMNSWVLGRNGRTIQNFKEASGLVYAKLDKDKQQLLVCGTRNAVEDAVAMFETHMIYFPVFTQMDEEMEKILSQLEEYGDRNARREWTRYHEDQPEEDWGRGKSAKGASKAAGSKSGGGKSNGKRSNKNSGYWEEWNDWDWNQADWEWEEKETWQGSPKGKGGKKGSGGKSGKGRHADVEEDEEEPEEEEEEEEHRPVGGKGKGFKGKGKPRGKWVRK
eukprot:TRINITY_DN1769_c0_g2_i3.p1 TRINITY_DN1769_c0_g2~~TRINITY_DN1769_c0_g2_i3.p1  ORF type:complete len:555 (-),score=174.40 TRINITY_DN1769_c0_g2_i3:223-1887(-)